MSLLVDTTPLRVSQDFRSLWIAGAFALRSTYGRLGMTAAPAVAGALIGALGVTSAYIVDVTTYALALVAFGGVASSPPVEGAGAASVASILEGLRFLRGHSVIM